MDFNAVFTNRRTDDDNWYQRLKVLSEAQVGNTTICHTPGYHLEFFVRKTQW